MKILTSMDFVAQKAKTALANHRRIARKFGVELLYNANDLRNLLLAAQTCEYCRCPISFADAQIDHALPLARGSRSCVLGNLVVACCRCNRLKGQMDSQDYRRFHSFLQTLDPHSQDDICRRLQGGWQIYHPQGGSR